MGDWRRALSTKRSNSLRLCYESTTRDEWDLMILSFRLLGLTASPDHHSKGRHRWPLLPNPTELHFAIRTSSITYSLSANFKNQIQFYRHQIGGEREHKTSVLACEFKPTESGSRGVESLRAQGFCRAGPDWSAL